MVGRAARVPPQNLWATVSSLCHLGCGVAMARCQGASNTDIHFRSESAVIVILQLMCQVVKQKEWA